MTDRAELQSRLCWACQHPVHEPDICTGCEWVCIHGEEVEPIRPGHPRYVATLQDRIRVLEADLATARELLTEHEWSGQGQLMSSRCPYCWAYQGEPHLRSCKLAVFMGFEREGQ